jgi:hypothetical protein
MKNYIAHAVDERSFGRVFSFDDDFDLKAAHLL